MTKKRISKNFETLDPAIVNLCEAINEFHRIRTIESCQGFIDDHRPRMPWTVYFQPDGLISPEAYIAIEFLAWALGRWEAGAAGFDVSLTLHSAPPHLNGPGTTMYFCIEGRNRHPDDLAALIREMREECFVIPEEWKSPDDQPETLETRNLGLGVKETPHKFAGWVRQRRLELGLSQDDLTNRLGGGTASSIEMGQVPRTHSKISRLASALEVSVEEVERRAAEIPFKHK